MINMHIVPTCRAEASAELLHQYEGPTAFAIPGNHDWIDGLETYTRHIQHKGWLGGWLLPQVGLCPTTAVADLACFRCLCWGPSTAFAASAGFGCSFGAPALPLPILHAVCPYSLITVLPLLILLACCACVFVAALPLPALPASGACTGP